jgi:hypothetical protein
MPTKDPTTVAIQNVAESLDACAKGLDRIANALRALGNADAATSMGAIEALGAVLKDSLDGAGTSIADAIRDSRDQH